MYVEWLIVTAGSFAGGLGQEDRHVFPPEAGFEQLWELNPTATKRRDTSEAPRVNPLSPSFIWEYDLYFLK